MEFYVRSHSYEYGILAQSCLSVRPFFRLSTWNSSPTGRIYMKFDIRNFSKLDRES
jgi:hypothetical protein